MQALDFDYSLYLYQCEKIPTKVIDGTMIVEEYLGTSDGGARSWPMFVALAIEQRSEEMELLALVHPDKIATKSALQPGRTNGRIGRREANIGFPVRREGGRLSNCWSLEKP